MVTRRGTIKRFAVQIFESTKKSMVTEAPSNKNYVLKEKKSKGLQSRAVKIRAFKILA